MIPNNKIILQDLLFEIDLTYGLNLPLYSQVKIKIKSINWLKLVPEYDIIL